MLCPLPHPRPFPFPRHSPDPAMQQLESTRTTATLAATASRKANVFLVEDHHVVREGLEMLINGQSDLAVCGGAESAADALAAVKKSKADVVVIDISLGDGSGLDLIKALYDRD